MTKPSYEEPFVTLSYGGTFTAKNVEDALLGAKAELDKAELELARMRGLLQRQWVSVEERMPDGINEFWCWVVARPEDECMTDTSGKPISGVFSIKPHFDTVKTYHTKHGELRFNCGALEKVTHWMPLPAPPNFPQPSSLVPQGAESADIGKLDSVDDEHRIQGKVIHCKSGVEMGKVNKFDSVTTDEEAKQMLDARFEGSAETGGEPSAGVINVTSEEL